MSNKLKKKSVHQISIEDELNLFQIFEILWQDRYKILIFSIIASILGTLIYFSTPVTYEINTKISPTKNSIFTDYYKLNKYLLKIDQDTNSEVSETREIITEENTSNIFLIDSKNIFNLVIEEFNDFDEVKIIISKIESIFGNDSSNIDKIEKSKLIENYANDVQIIHPNDFYDYHYININWHDLNEASSLINEIIQLTLENTKISLISQFEKMIEYNEFNINNEIESEKIRLENLYETQKLIEKKRVLYLREQSKIAKSLGIQKSIFDNSNNEIFNETLRDLNIISVSPDYLFGYEALDREIDLILSRSDDESILFNPDYVELNNNLQNLYVKASISGKLRKELDFLKSDNPNDWLSYDLSRSEVSNSRKPIHYYILFSFILGFLLSSIYFLVISSYKNRKF